jgi:hypothetical protein
MTQAQKVFEALMLGKGYIDLSKKKDGNYSQVNIQTRWNYFRLGWNMCEVNKG